MHAQRSGSVGDRDCLTRVLGCVAEEWNDARWDDRRDGFEHVPSSAMFLRRRDDGAQCDADIIDTATLARVVELGGEVLAGPLETAIGPMASMRDAVGAMFSVFQAPDVPL